MAEYFACWLKIPEECQEQLEQIVSDYDDFDWMLVGANPRIIEYIFNEVKWGELDFLDQLHEQGIPFDFSNDHSEDSRHISCRFTSDGEMILQDYFESDTRIEGNDFIRTIDLCTSPEEKLKFLNEQYMKLSNLLTLLPWDNQVEYGKLYRTRKLIEPS